MAEAIVVLAMIITTFSFVCTLSLLWPSWPTLQVDDYVNLRDTRYKASAFTPFTLVYWIIFSDAPLLSGSLRSCRVCRMVSLVWRDSSSPSRVFEIFIAFDALRLRNTIQLIGLLSKYSVRYVALSDSVNSHLVFHAALIICAALQVYETKTALVTLDDCDGTYNYVVRRGAIAVPESFTWCYTTQICGGAGTLWAKVKPLLIVAPCILTISWFFMLFFIKKLFEEFGLDKALLGRYLQLIWCHSWAIFHVVGANPKMKSENPFILWSSYTPYLLHIELCTVIIRLCFVSSNSTSFLSLGSRCRFGFSSLFALLIGSNALTVTYSCDSIELDWIRHYNCRYTNRPRASSIMRPRRSARD
jgi:hypothetical protein